MDVESEFWNVCHGQKLFDISNLSFKVEYHKVLDIV